MVSEFEFADIDWSNQDINEVVDFFTKKFNIQEKEITRREDQLAQKDDVIAQLQDMITQQADRIKQLEGEVTQMKSRGRRSSGSRSYNMRQYKDYPHQPSKRSRPDNLDSCKFYTTQQTVDIKFCPTCGERLADKASTRTRESEDVIDGRYEPSFFHNTISQN
ncbi:MAG: hypothetical protein F4202_01280 [Cenarchaeum sp. SB0677_bin_16]|nr:hypothetical protein [Cenarchaeum sp. SB0677_bin_16]